MFGIWLIEKHRNHSPGVRRKTVSDVRRKVTRAWLGEFVRWSLHRIPEMCHRTGWSFEEGY